jgi:uncharacterized coiled-coil protein SlyX
MATTTETSPLQAATAAVDEHESTAEQWAAEGRSARAEWVQAKQELASASLADPQQAYDLMTRVETLESRVKVAASLRAAAAERLGAAEAVATRERITEQRAAVAEMWARWAKHQARTDDLLRQLQAHDEHGYEPLVGNRLPGVPANTAGRRMRCEALDADSRITTLEIAAFGSAVVVRSGPVQPDGKRQVWITFAAQGAHLTDDWQPHRFTATADGAPLLEYTSTRSSGRETYQREVPATAVVVVRGETAHCVDDPAGR